VQDGGRTRQSVSLALVARGRHLRADWQSFLSRVVVQGAVEDGDRVAGEVDPVAVDGRMDQAGAVGGLQAGEAIAAEAVRPVGGQGGVGAAGDRVFGDAARWCEVPGDEVLATVPVRGGGDDDPADAVPAGQAG
jgi:hypothetical protein